MIPANVVLRQNTTLEAEEYQWNGLIVIDTPGIDSMQERQELETTALEYADGSDLILFLMPHQIEQADFVRFSRFYKQNKPISIPLNIKADICKRSSSQVDEPTSNSIASAESRASLGTFAVVAPTCTCRTKWYRAS